MKFRRKCVGSYDSDISRDPENDCKCPEGYYDNYPLELECSKCLDNCL